MNALRILVIEDEAKLANAVKQGLVEEDFAVVFDVLASMSGVKR